jgi:peptidoglycan hydrolase-like protein with peptidoglycan-binding domain
LRAAGFACLTDSKYLTSSAFLVAGDVLLNDKHHTATAVTNGIQSDGSIPAAATMPLLKKGSQGEAVKKLQQTLNGKGYKLTEDGDFGNKTEAAVKAFQKANGLEVDGEVGPMTWGVLLK